jgi:hypothetical protein
MSITLKTVSVTSKNSLLDNEKYQFFPIKSFSRSKPLVYSTQLYTKNSYSSNETPVMSFKDSYEISIISYLKKKYLNSKPDHYLIELNPKSSICMDRSKSSSSLFSNDTSIHEFKYNTTLDIEPNINLPLIRPNELESALGIQNFNNKNKNKSITNPCIQNNEMTIKNICLDLILFVLIEAKEKMVPLKKKFLQSSPKPSLNVTSNDKKPKSSMRLRAMVMDLILFTSFDVF